MEESGEVVTLAHDSEVLRVVQMTTVSVSYDVAKVDEMTAASFVNRLSFYLSDPELLLL